MNPLREAAQQALEALEYDNPAGRSATIRALRAALAQEQAEPVQEPVAWMVYTEGGASAYVTDNPRDLIGAYRALPLYTAPPQRKLVPLTDEEIYHATGHCGVSKYTAINIARAIERAIWEKNNGQA